MKITFIIGNGFDIAIAEKNNIRKTKYTDFYKFNDEYDFNKIEEVKNKIVESIYGSDFKKYLCDGLWSDFEVGLVNYFNNNIKTNNDIIDFFSDFDQISGYLSDFLKLFDCNAKIDLCVDEFKYSILNFLDRIENDDYRNKIKNYIKEKCSDNKNIIIDFVCFNGTSTLKRLCDEIINTDKLQIKIDRDVYDVVMGDIKYVHSKLNEKTTNYHNFAFGTTENISSFATARGYDAPYINDSKNIFKKIKNLYKTENEQYFNKIPDSIKNILVKTNYDFGQWIANTDLFITHGISFGKTDSYYWNNLRERLYDSKLIDFSFVSPKIKRNPAEFIKEQKQKILKNNYNNLKENIIVSVNSNFKKDISSAGIFSF